MCGINGFAGKFGPTDASLIARMNQTLIHRGPDDCGVYLDPHGRAGLGHARLSILDLSPAGHQPMSDHDRQVHLVFNGEIYNYRELRLELERAGHRFRSHTDTEVLLRLYLEQGERMLDRLNGMFAFAIWDERTATLFAARDHFGIKPFYYHAFPDGRLIFSSEVKSLFACPEVPRGLHLPALADYLSFLWVSDPLTMFEGIQKLPPGHKLRWRDGRLDVECWWDLEYPDEPLDVAEEELAEELCHRLDVAVKRQLISDVPVGAFLSGGLDSSAIAAAMTRAHAGEVRCYTMGWNDDDNIVDQLVNDLPYAREVAKHLGVSLKEVRATPDITELWPRMIYHLDEPVADPAAISSYMIAKLARDDGTVVLLSGAGADELFAGYRRHCGPALMGRLAGLPRPIGRLLARGSRWLPGSRAGTIGGVLRRSRKLLAGAGLSEEEQFILYTQWTSEQERLGLLTPDVREIVARRDPAWATHELLVRHPRTPPLNRYLYRDLKTFLPALNFLYTDKTGMAVGLECRVPYLDLELVEFAARVPCSLKLHGLIGKYLLRKAVGSRLPADILTRPKTGFGAPLRKWITQDLREMVDDLLSRETIERRGLFQWEAVEAMKRATRTGAADHGYIIWALLTLELWQRIFLDGDSAHGVTDTFREVVVPA